LRIISRFTGAIRSSRASPQFADERVRAHPHVVEEPRELPVLVALQEVHSDSSVIGRSLRGTIRRTRKDDQMASEQQPRRRDPGRRDRILAAAAELAARRGFHTVGMADIGAEAGIVGSGVYRHFTSKDAILVALLDRVMDRLAQRAAEIVSAAADDRSALSALVRDHIQVAITDRSVLAVYHREVHNLPEDDRRRLRRRQRHYLEEWVHVLAPLRRDLADGELRLAVHAAIGAVQSTLFFRSGLSDERLAELLDAVAHGCLGVDPAPIITSEFMMTRP
jgi:AcrR family transcriptional regulator